LPTDCWTSIAPGQLDLAPLERLDALDLYRDRHTAVAVVLMMWIVSIMATRCDFDVVAEQRLG
jgi:hypothetical protein